MPFRFLLLFLFLLGSKAMLIVGGNNADNSKTPLKKARPYFTENEPIWVDSVFNTMDLDAKIGQVFMLAAYSNQSEGEYQKLQNNIEKYKIGGLIFMQGNPKTQAQLTNRYQNVSKIPLLISVDGEWGLGMRLSNVISYPKAITLGAIQDNSLIKKMGADMAQQLKRMGVHLNFAPVADVNSNSENPVIGYRSFGEDKNNVAQKAIALMKGMQQNGIIANAKHFPGHGDAATDSHFGIPKINHSAQRLDDVDLFPFKEMIKDSLMSVITGHLLIPSVESRNIATSMSDRVIIDLLKTKLGFKGLVITDALNMKGATKNYPNAGDMELQAYLAGNDILLMADNAIAGINKIKAAVMNGIIDKNDLDIRVKKILKAKYWAGLNIKKEIVIDKIEEDLNLPKYLGLKEILYENAVTLVQNNQNIVPINSLNQKNIVSVAIGAELGNSFQKTLLRFGTFPIYSNESRSDETWYNSLLNTLYTGKTVIVSLHKMSNYPSRRYNISPTTISFLNRLQKQNKVLLVLFGNPYALKYFPDLANIVCGYEDDPIMQEATAQVVFGSLPALGKLPVSVENMYQLGQGIITNSSDILGYSLPEAVGINSKILANIDNIVNTSISQKILPGCNLLIARNGKIAYTKSYGNLRYESGQRVTPYTVYDLASVTKVAATLQAVMKLKDIGLLDLNQKASFYLPELDSTNKSKMTITDILKHQAGLHGYIAFWEYTKKNQLLDTTYYSHTKSKKFPFTIATGIYGDQALKDSLWHWIIESPLISRKNKLGEFSYLYSDLGLIILQKVVERITGMALNNYCENTFYHPLNLERTGFNIFEKVSVDQIAPTENDMAFRGVQIHGTVQDQQAAMLGGVAGHAGLFSSLYDLAKIMQMNLNGGHYNNIKFFAPETVGEFTKYASVKGHRALGWDKQPDDHDSHYISSFASADSYGHSGYTGTMVWVDPKYNLVYIFLANRIYPNANNNKLNVLKIRRKIHDLVYQAISN
jgi:beta-N-acetylhexosaminidase